MNGVDYLVQIAIALPDDWSESRRAAARADELRRGRELVEAGVIRRIWRVTGRTANVGIWTASSLDELRAALSSLPMFPWMTITVTELGRHPLEESTS